jgi:recombination protein RecA
VRGPLIGNRTRVRVKKNKVAAPFRVAEFDIMYDEGISRASDVLDLAVGMDIVDKRGSYYSYRDERLAQGREITKTAPKQRSALMREIENVVRETNGLPLLPVVVPDQEPEAVLT